MIIFYHINSIFVHINIIDINIIDLTISISYSVMKLLYLCVIFLPVEPSPRIRRDAIGQNRLGNNVRSFIAGKSSWNSSVKKYDIQFMKWLASNAHAKQLLMHVLKNGKHEIQNPQNGKQSLRFRKFRRHHSHWNQ